MSERGAPSNPDFKRPSDPEASPASKDVPRGRGGFPRGKSSWGYRGRGDQGNAPVMSMARGRGNHYNDPGMSPGNNSSNRGYDGNQGGPYGNQSNCNDNNFRTPSPANRKRSHSREGHRRSSNSRDDNRNQGRDGSQERSRSGSRPYEKNGEQRHLQEGYRERSRSKEKGNSNLWSRSPQYNRSPNNNRQNYSSPNARYGSGYSPQHGQSGYGHSPQWTDDFSPEWGQYNPEYSPQGRQNWRGSNNYSPEKRGRGRQGGQYSSTDFSSDGQTPDRNRRRWEEDPDVFLSKTLSSILRHNAERFGFKLMKGGFLYVDDILQYVHKLHGYTAEDVKRIVDSNDKKRFALESEEGRLKIRANQGHSIEVEDLDLTPISSADEVPVVIHGTYYTSWELIKKTGLRRMNRNHIHFAAGEPGENGVISGMRKTCEVMIHLDMEKALKDGLKFFRSANNVILCSGDENGFIYPCYFSGVLDRINRCRMHFDHTISASTAEEKPSESKKRKKKNKGKNTQEEATEPKEEMPKEPETKESEDGATTDDTSLPAAKKQHVSQPATPDNHSADSSVTGNVETNRNENREFDSDKVKSKDWQEPRVVGDATESKTLVESLCSNPPPHIAVCCVGQNLGHEDSRIRAIVLTSHPNSYVYHLHDENRHLIKEGHLEQLLINKDINKVFHDIGAVSTSLIQEFDVLMDGTPIWDISMLFSKVSPLPSMDLEVLEFDKGMFKKWTRQNEDYGQKMSSEDSFDANIVGDLVERGILMWDLYRVCSKKLDEGLTKKLKKEIFAAAIPSTDFLAEKIEALKLEKKKKTSEKPKGAPQQPNQQQQKQQQQQQKQQQQKQQGKGKKSGKGKRK